MILRLAYYGDPILHEKAKSVEKIDNSIRQLVRDMAETMRANDGIGLAAPQVHKPLRLFITCVPIHGPDDSWLPGQLRVFINPKIVSVGKEKWRHNEGCLSIPQVNAEVVRSLNVVVEATDLDGNRFHQEFSGLEARCILHENDHINGILFIDRIPQKERKRLEPLLQEVIRLTHWQQP